MVDLAGRVLQDRYELLRRQGQSALGVVWAARDRQEGRLVALKVVEGDAGPGDPLRVDQARFGRFAREMKASFLVTHRNTVEVVDAGEATLDGAGTVHWLALEWLACHPLSAELAKGPLPWGRAARIGAQVAQALGAAHQENVVHRGLCPERILMLENCDGDYAKVADFGMAKMLDAEAGDGDEDTGELSSITNTNTLTRLGDPHYVAPEYVEHGRFGPRSDLYALGAVLFHLVAGRPPFQGDLAAQFDGHLKAEPPRLRALVPGVPEWFESLVTDLLAKDPAKRPGVYKIVQRIEDGLDAPLVLPELWPLDPEGRPVRPPPVEVPRTSPAVLALGVALAAGIGIGGSALLAVAVAAVLVVVTR